MALNGKTVSQVNKVNTQSYNPTIIKVLSLNLAHGRGTAFNQLFVTTGQITKNLNDIAEFLETESPDIIALQEADA